MNRRDFFKTTGAGAAGLLLGFALPEKNQLQAQFPPPPVFKPSAFIHIGTDETVTFIIHKSEMGQGPVTSLSQILAEELDCDWSKVRTEFAPVESGALRIPGRRRQPEHPHLVDSAAPGRRHRPRDAGPGRRAAVGRPGIASSAPKTASSSTPSTNAKLSYGTLAEAAAKLPVPGQRRSRRTPSNSRSSASR